MKALEQNYRSGELRLVDIPTPRPGSGHVVVRTEASLASVGTERGMIELAKKSLLGKALARPDLVRQVWLKARAEGPLEAWRQAWGRLNVPILLGYSSAGEVVEVGPDVTGLRPGDRVACAGAGVAGHVEMALVPVNLCAPIPPGVTYEQASFVALGGIALESIRMARVAIGERVVVIGLGLIGQLVVRLLRAAGCHVFATDRDPAKNELSLMSGAEAAASATDFGMASSQIQAWARGAGADAVIVTAATESNEPVRLAADVSRERGRIVVTGVVGMEVPRRAFYDKELELVVSRAWGPGLYDVAYASKGLDYPSAYARWTARRNIEEFLAQLERRTIAVDDLITHRYPIEEAPTAYEMILGGRERCIGVVITYPGGRQHPDGLPAEPDGSAGVGDSTGQQASAATGPAAGTVVWLNSQGRTRSKPAGRIAIGVIGAGQYANGTLLPALRRVSGISMRGIATRTGLSGTTAGSRYGFDYCTADHRELLADPQIDLVLILTRHDSHAVLAADALRAGKHVFVEKPLAVNSQQMEAISSAYRTVRDAAVSTNASSPLLMVGFNRRFSPQAQWLRARFGVSHGPLSFSCTVNAGPLGAGSWIADRDVGGGRIIGEVCHFVDLAQFMTGASPVKGFAQRVGDSASTDDDSVACTLTMADGSIAQIGYFARGDRGHPRERVELFGDGSVGVIENFRNARYVRGGRTRTRGGGLSVDRGHRAELEALARSIAAHEPAPVAFDDYAATTLATFALEKSLVSGLPERVGAV